MSRFTIANGMTESVRDAFRCRPRVVEHASGFVRMDVISPADHREEIWLLTYWTDEDSYRVWHRSHEYHTSHKGIPKGLKLVPGTTRIEFFDHIAS